MRWNNGYAGGPNFNMEIQYHFFKTELTYSQVSAVVTTLY